MFIAIVEFNHGTTINYTHPPTHRLPALPFSTYIGRYRNNYVGEIAMIARAGKLMLLQGPDKQAYA